MDMQKEGTEPINRKRSEQNGAFLTEISRGIQALESIDTAMELFCERIGRYFGVTWCLFSELGSHETSLATYGWRLEGAPALMGSYRSMDFLPDEQLAAHNEGRLTIVADTLTDPRINGEAYRELGIRSFVIVPLSRDGKRKFQVSIIHTEPRVWHDDEIELIREITSRIWTRLERARGEEQLVNELSVTKKLQQISNHLIEEDNIQALYQAIVDVAMELMHADFASIQAVTREKEELFLLAHRNFNESSAKKWEYVRVGSTTSCARALATGERTIVPNIDNCPYEMGKEDYEAYRSTGIRAVQSTPLISRSGHYIGMISTHWRQPYVPRERELGLMDVLARQAADLIEKRKAEESLKESEERLQLSVRAAGIFTWEVDPQTGQTKYSHNFNEVLGYEIAIAARDNFMNIHPDDIEFVVAAVEKAIRGESPLDIEHRIIHPLTNETIWLKAQGQLVRRTASAGPVLIGITQNITTQKRAEENLRELLRQKDEFIGIASHELKTPVTSIKAYAQFITRKMSASGDEENALVLDRLNRQIDRLTKLITQLLDTTRISEGQLKLSLEKVDMRGLMEERIAEISRTTNHHFSVDIAVLPSVRGDRERIGQVITNLISNAVKYSPAESVITVVGRLLDDKIEVSVCDEGLGIAEEDKTKIFDRYYRVSNEQTNNSPGIGLGLYIAAEIIYRHQGRIWVDSTPGKGSTFYFTLPLGTHVTS